MLSDALSNHPSLLSGSWLTIISWLSGVSGSWLNGFGSSWLNGASGGLLCGVIGSWLNGVSGSWLNGATVRLRMLVPEERGREETPDDGNELVEKNKGQDQKL